MSTVEKRARQAAWAWVRAHYGRQGLPWREACVDSYLAGHDAATTEASAALERAREELAAELALDVNGELDRAHLAEVAAKRALERANGLLREAHKELNGEQDCCLKAMEAHGYAHDDDCLAGRIDAHLGGQQTPGAAPGSPEENP